MKVSIASRNPVKIGCVKKGFQEMFPSIDFSFEGVAVPSGVEDQPMDDKTTFMGANNRVLRAMEAMKDADFWVGIEGGIERAGNEMSAFAWIVIRSRDLTGKSRTASFYLPGKVTELIEAGKELGEADDLVFGHTNSKQKNGAVGILTDNTIDRTGLYTQAVILALIPFKNTDMY